MVALLGDGLLAAITLLLSALVVATAGETASTSDHNDPVARYVLRAIGEIQDTESSTDSSITLQPTLLEKLAGPVASMRYTNSSSSQLNGTRLLTTSTNLTSVSSTLTATTQNTDPPTVIISTVWTVPSTGSGMWLSSKRVRSNEE